MSIELELIPPAEGAERQGLFWAFPRRARRGWGDWGDWFDWMIGLIACPVKWGKCSHALLFQSTVDSHQSKVESQKVDW